MIKDTINADVIIVGAGAAGLMAAYTLSRKNIKVLVLEAHDRLGGRIHTVTDKGFSQPVELGAEFIHGNLPITLQLLKDAGIKYIELTGKFVSFRGKPHKEKDFVEEPGLLERKLKELKKDITVKEFLKKYLAGSKYKEIRNSVKGFVEGYDTANIACASTFGFRDEWLGGDDQQYRIEGGYIKLVTYLKKQCEMHNCSLIPSSIVKQIKWKQGGTEIKTKKGKSYFADRVLITVSPGVLSLPKTSKGAIEFVPSIPDHIKAAKALGYGSIIKIHIQFKNEFWTDEEIKKRTGVDTDGLGFIFSDQEFPTWWTQYPVKSNVLTGWLGGPTAAKLKQSNEKIIFNKAILSLCAVFKLEKKELLSKITSWKITNWTADPFIHGSYTYAIAEDYKHRAVLSAPIENTIYFAGEALYSGPGAGTVEAALASGYAASYLMIK